MSEAVNLLRHPPRLWTRDEMLQRPCPVPAVPGLYAWFFREIPPGVPVDGCITWKETDGLRRLRVLRGVVQGRRWSALADEDRQRVIIYLNEEEDPDEIERAMKAAGPNWASVRDFVNRHDRRRCAL